MKSKLIILIFVFFAFIGCNSDDDSIDISGDTWILNRVVCFCFFEDDFDFSNHTVRFNTSSRFIIIGNSEDTQFLAPAGVYTYSLEGDIITIEGGNKYRYEENGDSLVLTYIDDPLIADDEITYYYTRN